jgi:imidazolonepropionase-like amidohydrolase
MPLLAAVALTLLIRDVTLIDGTGSPPRQHANVLVHDGRVEAVWSGSEAAPQDAVAADLVVNGSGRFLIPGLFDAHVHLSGGDWPSRVDDLRRVLRGGVTSVYDLAGDVRQTSDLSRAVLAGEVEGPTIDYTALMAGPAFFTDPRVVAASLGYTPGQAPWNRAITSDTDIVTAVAAAKGAGATALKLYAALDAPTADRIAAEAKRQGLRLVAHATTFPARPSDLVEAGVNMLAHAAYLVWEGSPPSTDYTARARGDFAHVPPDSPVIRQLLEKMRDRHVALNPTLWIFTEGSAKDDLAAVRTPWMNVVTQLAAETGVAIVAGTDSMLDPSGRDPLPRLHRELESLVTGAHLTPMQAIVSATGAAADAIGVGAERGTIAPGKRADLVLLRASPLDDIRNTRTIELVIKDGRLVSSGGK